MLKKLYAVSAQQDVINGRVLVINTLQKWDWMEKIIEHNKDELILKYIVVTLFSLLTLRKLKRVEKYRMELKDEKERQDQETDFDKL